MSIYQIAKIQLRRGRSTDGLPQLSSAELGWVIDSQELYIGNGSVEEGAPGIGNTRILTERDNFTQYTYKANNSAIETSFDQQYPVSRDIFDRLDDYTTSANFDIQHASVDQSDKMQLALKTLYANPAYFTPNSRPVLNFLPGEYYIDKPVFIPAYTAIIGAGQDRTIFKFGPNGRFILVGDNFNFETLEDDLVYNSQNKFTVLANLTISTSYELPFVILFNGVRDGCVTNIKIISDTTLSHKAIVFMNSLLPDYNDPLNNVSECDPLEPNFVTNQRNIFNNVSVYGFEDAVYSDCYITNNYFNVFHIKTAYRGFNLGHNQGPVDNNINNCIFENIKEQGILLHKGTQNISSNNKFIDVGNDFGTEPVYNQITFVEPGNISSNDIFDRVDQHDQNTIPYIASIGGSIEYSNNQQLTATISNDSTAFLIQLPKYDHAHYQVFYIIRDTDGHRRGVFDITVNGLDVNFDDTFDYVGSSSYATIEFDTVVDADQIQIHYASNSLNTQLKYTYKITT